MSLKTGAQFDHYEILALLGAGGMGEVWRARDLRLSREVAIKILPEEFARDADRLRRFEREARAASALNHPNIVTIYEIGNCDGINYIAAEHVEGITLRERINHSPVRLRETINISLQIAGALIAAHAAGITHRDIKPENIMLRSDGYVKILDFGLAKLTEERPVATDSATPTLVHVKTDPGKIMGTISYMSPEQTRGQQVDSRTDIFSLGVILYEMISGRQPFSEPSGPDVLAAILHKDPTPLPQLVPDLPAEANWIITKALTKDREERYQTVKGLAGDLKRLRQRLEFEAELERSVWVGLRSDAQASMSVVPDIPPLVTQPSSGATPVPTRHVSSAEYLIGEVKRHKWLALAFLCTLLLAALVAGYFTLRERPIESLAVLPLINDSSDEETTHLCDGMTTQLINSLIQLPNIRVKAYESVTRYIDKPLDFAKIASELDVQALLIGRVKRRGNILSLQITLIDSRDSSQKWGKQYSYNFSNLMLAEQQVTQDVVENLRSTLRLQIGEEKRVAAIVLYQQGRYFWNQRTAAAMEKARGYFELAVETDPQYALAYAGLADCYAMLAAYNAMSPRAAFPKAREAALRALAIDDQLAEARGTLAMVAFLSDWNWPAADREFRNTIELKPDYATVHQWHSLFLVTQGKPDEALLEARLTQELDPLSRIIKVHQGRILYFAGRFEQSAEQLQQALEQDPGFFAARRYLGLAYAELGRHAEAIAELKQALDLSEESPLIMAELGYAYAAAGRHNEARRIINELQSVSDESALSFQLAAVYAGLGDKDASLKLLQKAYDERSDRMPYLKVEPRFRRLRSDPDFTKLLARLNLN